MHVPRISSTWGPTTRKLTTISVLVTFATASLATGGSAATSDESAVPGLAMQEARLWHTSNLLADGSVLLVGGNDRNDAHASAELYDPIARRFDLTGSLDRSRAVHTATRLEDGGVLVIGGARRTARGSIERFETETGTFRPAGRLRQARATHSATLLDSGHVLIVGGSQLGRRSKPLASVELYDPRSERTKRVGRVKEARAHHTATQLEDGKVLVVGGVSRRGRPVASAELYDPVTRRFKTVGSLANARLYHTATLLDDGHVLIVGGTGEGESPVAAELYDPVSRRFETVAKLNVPRVFHTSTLLDDGRVLVIGGVEQESVEVYDPGTRSFAPAGPLRSVRMVHAATRLEDGTVLITGGTYGRRTVDWAEVYDPSVMAVVAYGPVDPAATDSMLESASPPLPPLGRTRGGGRIEMAGSGFAMTFPDDWSIEVADPDPDVFNAAPGEAWEALRAHDPERRKACSVSVGVATKSLRDRSGVASGSATTEPGWDEDDKTTLWAPEPRLEPTAGGIGTMTAPRERLHKREPHLENDVMYAVSCSAAGDGGSDAFDRELEGLTATFEFLPSKG